MRRAGAASVTKGSGKTQEQRLREYFFGKEGAALMEPGAARKQVERMIREGEELPPEVAQALHDEIRSTVERNLRANGGDPRSMGPQVESVTRQVERLVLEGKSQAEIDRMIRDGQIRPSVHGLPPAALTAIRRPSRVPITMRWSQSAPLDTRDCQLLTPRQLARISLLLSTPGSKLHFSRPVTGSSANKRLKAVQP